MNKKDLIDDILYQRCSGGETCADIAENHAAEVFEVDDKLYKAMNAVNDSISDMLARLRELNDELDLDYTDI